MTRLAVITAIFGKYDGLKDPQGDHPGVDFYCFSDTLFEHKTRWRVVDEPYWDIAPMPGTHNTVYASTTRITNMMKAKFYKMQFHKIPLLAAYDYVMWVDGSFQVKAVDLMALTEKFLTNHDVALHRHSIRDNLEDEVYYCENNRIDYIRERYHDQNMYYQCLHYLAEGFDLSQSGLQELGNFVVRLQQPLISELFDLWWRENQLYTFQDQISMPYCLWKVGVEPYFISSNVYDNPFAKHSGHAKQESPLERPSASGKIQSFDCFDTLVVRLHPEPHAVYRRMEVALKKPGFKAARIKAERDDADLEQIYQNLVTDGFFGSSEAQLCRLYEYFSEMAGLTRNNHLIQCYREDDIVVSDMYWTEVQLRRLFNKMNMSPRHIFVSPAGKARGDIWSRVFSKVAQSNFKSHIGDNMKSDVEVASHYLPAVHYTESQLTLREQVMADHGYKYLAGLCRAMRLQNPFYDKRETSHANYHMWRVYAQVWLAMDLLLAQFLAQRVKELKATTILFLSRDMFLIHRLFQVLYPEIESKYVFFSRVATQEGSKVFVDYFKSHSHDQALVIDLQGSGHTFYEFQKKYNIKCLTFITCFGSKPHPKPGYEFLFYHDLFNDYIERMNYSVHGSFVGFDGSVSRPQVLPLEYDKSLVDVYMSQVFQVLPLLRQVKEGLLTEDIFSRDSCHTVLRQLFQFSTEDLNVMNQLNHENFHLDLSHRITLTDDAVKRILHGKFDEFNEDIGTQALARKPILFVNMEAESDGNDHLHQSIWFWLAPVLIWSFILLMVAAHYWWSKRSASRAKASAAYSSPQDHVGGGRNGGGHVRGGHYGGGHYNFPIRQNHTRLSVML